MRQTRQAPVRTKDEQLLAEVYADPANDAPRLVYADWLMENGDPRGEMISLQINGSNPRRLRQLLKKHFKEWLGPIAPIVREPVFERGFLTSCTVEATSAPARALLLHPSWATVTRIVAYDTHAVESPAMKSLRCVSGLLISEVAKLAARKEPLRIEAIEQLLVNRKAESDDWKALYQIGAFHRLHELGVALDEGADVAFGSWKWLLCERLGERLTRLRVDMSDYGVPTLSEWLKAFTSSDALQTLELVPTGESSLRIDRSAVGFRIRYELHVKTSDADLEWRYGERSTARLFAGFPLETVPHLDIALHPKTKPASVAQAQKFFERHFARRFASIACFAMPADVGIRP